MSLNDCENKTCKGHIDKYTQTVPSVGKNPWQALMNNDLVTAICGFLGIPVTGAQAAPPTGDQGEKKGKKKDKDEKKDEKDGKGGEKKDNKEKKDKKDKGTEVQKKTKREKK